MIQIQKDHLLIACKHLQRIVPRKPTLPVLACVKIEPALNHVRLMATDCDRTAHITIPTGTTSKLEALRAKKAGAVLVDSGVLANAAATADAGSFVRIDRDHIQVIIEGQASNIPIAVEDTEFPELPSLDWLPVSGQIDLDALKRLLRCVSIDEGRYILCGVNWDKEGYLIATDGRRLHREPFTPLPEGIDGVTIPTETARLIPARAAISIDHRMDGEKIVTGTHIAFVATENILTIRIFSKLVEGKYPNWRAVCPNPSGNSVRFNNDQAASSLRKIAKIAGTSKRDIDSTLIEVGPSSITFHVRHDGKNSGSFTQPAIIKGKPASIIFNTKYLIAALENGADTIDIADNMTPGIFSGVKDNTHILMPMRGDAPAPTSEPEEENEEEPVEA